jgi:sugar phosphate isomerase/epimerase
VTQGTAQTHAAGWIRPTLHGSQLRGARLTLDEKAALARTYGYPGLDFTLAEVRAYPGGPQGVRDVLAREGLQAATVGGVFGARLTDATDAEFDAALGDVKAAAQAVVACGGARSGTGLAGRAEQPRDVLWPLVVERLRRLDGVLDGTGVRLGVEFLGVKTLRPERPYAFVQSMAEANRLLEEAGARNIGLTLDSYHWYAGGDTLETIRQTPAARIALLHVNDAKDVPRERLDDQDRVMPGEGVIPLADWLAAIAATGFEGYIALEVLGPRLAGLSPQECARLGKESIDDLLAGAGAAR